MRPGSVGETRGHRDAPQRVRAMIGEPPRALAFVTCVLRGARAERRGGKGRSGARTLRGCLCRGVGKRNGGLQRDASSACARTQLKSWKGIHMFDPLCITEGVFDKHVVLYENGSALFLRETNGRLCAAPPATRARARRRHCNLKRFPPPQQQATIILLPNQCLTHITCHPRSLLALSW